MTDHQLSPRDRRRRGRGRRRRGWRRGRIRRSRILHGADPLLLNRLRDVEGLDEEIALLRLHARRLLHDDEQADPKEFRRVMRVLVQAVRTRERLDGYQQGRVDQNVARLLQEFHELFTTTDGSGDPGQLPLT